jgi:hypothetical protein
MARAALQVISSDLANFLPSTNTNYFSTNVSSTNQLAFLALLKQAVGVDHREDFVLLIADHHFKTAAAAGGQGVQLKVFVALQRIGGGLIQQGGQGLFEAIQSHGAAPVAVSVAPSNRNGHGKAAGDG